MQAQMHEYLEAFGILTHEEIDGLIRMSSHRKLKKDETFIQVGEPCRQVAFVAKGTLRTYFFASGGEEITYCITFPGSLLTAYSSFITGNGSEECIQAMTPSDLLVVPRESILALAESSPNWMRFLRMMAEQQYLELERRIFQLQKSSAAQRYADLVRHQPAYVKLIPLQYLASYLGITQRHLSRIRRPPSPGGT